MLAPGWTYGRSTTLTKTNDAYQGPATPDLELGHEILLSGFDDCHYRRTEGASFLRMWLMRPPGGVEKPGAARLGPEGEGNRSELGRSRIKLYMDRAQRNRRRRYHGLQD